jgi:hypothetical protein
MNQSEVQKLVKALQRIADFDNTLIGRDLRGNVDAMNMMKVISIAEEALRTFSNDGLQIDG